MGGKRGLILCHPRACGDLVICHCERSAAICLTRRLFRHAFSPTESDTASSESSDAMTRSLLFERCENYSNLELLTSIEE
jgi:hypothetical protein